MRSWTRPSRTNSGSCSAGRRSAFAPQQETDVAHPPRTQRVARRHLRVDERLGRVAQREVLRLVLEAENERDHIVAQREDGARVHRVLLDEPHHVRERDADVRVEEVAHGHRAVRAHLDPRLRDDAELAVAEEHALEIVVAFLHADDVAGRRDHLELHGLIRRRSRGAAS